MFSHNDICFSNILKLNDDKLMLIDYEDSSYNYRGFDLGVFFSSFMFNSAHDQFPYFTYDQTAFPSDEDQMTFINAYIEACKNICSEEELDDLTPEKLVLEGRAFALFFHLNSAIWAQDMVGKTNIEFSHKDWAIKRCEAYFYLKSFFFKKGFSILFET